MFRDGRKLLSMVVFVTALSFLAAAGSPVSAAEEAEAAPDSTSQVQQGPAVIKTYSSLTHLVHMICEEASSQFYDFFGPQAVYVKPFSTISEFPSRKISMLGMTLADQMTARVNSDSMENEVSGQYDQWMEGVLQEIDGYLRVHINGINVRGERRSYVVNIEMSESLYRALHSYVGG